MIYSKCININNSYIDDFDILNVNLIQLFEFEYLN